MKKNNRNVIISGTGSYAPEKIYTNKYLEKIVDTWIKNDIKTLSKNFQFLYCNRPKGKDIANIIFSFISRLRT